MGGEFGQWSEWNADVSLDWHLLASEEHRGVQSLVRDLNRLYREEPALWEADGDPSGFAWIDVHNAEENVVAFRRISPSTGREIVCVGNFSPVVRRDYRVGLPRGGDWREAINTDARVYAGTDVGNAGAVRAEATPWHGLPFSANVVLPPLAVVWLESPR